MWLPRNSELTSNIFLSDDSDEEWDADNIEVPDPAAKKKESTWEDDDDSEDEKPVPLATLFPHAFLPKRGCVGVVRGIFSFSMGPQ